jgi:hypothetical protein
MREFILSGSQEERISILKTALSYKGVSGDSGHYDIPHTDSNLETEHENSSRNDHIMSTPVPQTATDAGGIDL